MPISQRLPCNVFSVSIAQPCKDLEVTKETRAKRPKTISLLHPLSSLALILPHRHFSVLQRSKKH